jgi:CubicO group peptidase (beta-lactamase class C family)
LLAHAGGINPYHTTEGWDWFYKLTGTPTEQRAAFAARLLREAPAFTPGTKHEYSNAGVALVGAMAERVTGRTYQQLVSDLVFAPLGGRAAFGNPGLDAVPQPFGHVRGFFGRVKIVAPNDPDSTPPKVLEPSGDVSVSLPDYGAFLQMHLRGLEGLEGRDGVLRAATIKTLHTPVAPSDPAVGWALGWGVAVRDGVELHGHTGSNGSYIAIAAIEPARDLAIAIITNIGGDDDTLSAFTKLRPIVIAHLMQHGNQ